LSSRPPRTILDAERVHTDPHLGSCPANARDQGVDDEDVMFARPGPAVEYWEGED
jgi:hypothetical protein